MAQNKKQPPNNTTGYSTQDAAAKAVLTRINPQSIREFKEYAGLIYKDSSGKYHYTAPNPGTADSSDTGTAPNGATVVGDYHTHGDYSRLDSHGQIVRTTRARDEYNSDHFSGDDKSENRQDARSTTQFRGYLGTPRGALLIYNPITDTEGPLQ